MWQRDNVSETCLEHVIWSYQCGRNKTLLLSVSLENMFPFHFTLHFSALQPATCNQFHVTVVFSRLFPSKQGQLEEKSKCEWQKGGLHKRRAAASIPRLNILNHQRWKVLQHRSHCSSLGEKIYAHGLLVLGDLTRRVSVSSEHPRSCCCWWQVIAPFRLPRQTAITVPSPCSLGWKHECVGTVWRSSLTICRAKRERCQKKRV